VVYQNLGETLYVLNRVMRSDEREAELRRWKDANRGAGFPACRIADFPVGRASEPSGRCRLGNPRYARRASGSLLIFLVLVPLVLCLHHAFAAGTRVKDLVMVAGARDNQLVGYGLVAGLVG